MVTMVFKTFIITCKTLELLQYIVIYYVYIVAYKCYIALAQSLNNATAYYIVLILYAINTYMDHTNKHTSAYTIIKLLLCITVGFMAELLYFNNQKFPKGITFNKFCVKQ